MRNRLKSLELNGYKTFASRTEFEFSGDITVIVGPNGSGKSNIADALRWVLGEQSFRLLRGKRTDDMIFAGSQTRPRSGMASATVTFDNSDGWLPIDFSEVSITRKAYRDGNNEYQINGQRVRLRDVNELLASSGLSERTYTVIGQGLVDAALTLKAEERRSLFEEAAGIGLYRGRKEQALRRLDKTRRNLERIEDILSELAPRVRSLRRQASRAEQYDQVRADLEAVLREWYGYHWHKAQKELQTIRDEVSQHEKNLAAVKAEQETTEQSLAKMRDRISALRGQLNSWHRQLSQIHTRREETSRELAVSDERRRALQEQENRIQQEISRLEEEKIRQQTRMEDFQQRVDDSRQTAEIAESELEKAARALQARKAERDAQDETVQAARQEINQLTGKKAELAARKEEYETRIIRLEAELRAQAENLEKAESERDSHQARIDQAEIRREEERARLDGLQIELDKAGKALEKTRQERSDLELAAVKVNNQAARARAEMEVLAQAEASLSGYLSGAKVLLQAARDGKLSRQAAAFGSQLNVPEEFEVAVASALGDYVDAILLTQPGESDKALTMLAEESARATLLPLGDLSPLQPLAAPRIPGIIGVAADLVTASAVLRPAVDLLLGQVIIVEDRTAARAAVRGQDHHVRAVTRKGEVFYSSGAIMVDTGKRAAALSRPRERKSLEEQINLTDTKLAGINEKIESLKSVEAGISQQLEALKLRADEVREKVRSVEEVYRQASLDQEQSAAQANWLKRQQENLRMELAAVRQSVSGMLVRSEKADADLELATAALTEQSAKLEGISIEEQVSQLSYWEAQVTIGQQTLNDALQVFQEHQRTVAGIQARIEAQIEEVGKVKASLVALDYRVEEMRSSEGGIGGEIQALATLIEPAENELAKLELIQSEELSHESFARQNTARVERYYNQAQIALARRQEAMDTLRQRIESDFGLVQFEYPEDVSGPTPLPLGDAVQQLPFVEKISEDLDEILKEKRLQLRRLGAVNPDAQREFKEVSERHEFLTAQVEDLRKAELDIKEVISELDELMERDFRKTFHLVAKEFKQVFTRLFAGGSASLVLTEGEDIDSMGIDIEARLPGKRAQELSMLSGGERSLTAAALVFSLIKASPTPFCVMDEVDAMLDEANVARFRQVLEELSQDTQFVVITHNRHTVQAADVIYGITMGRDTTSQTISLKLEEVDERYSSG
ncbi:MAG: chromosome segregation protein SMC [Anaerolineales bacterium]|nr:chromosome segregation protein SMC [Anaerolineales bacterium]